MLTIMSSIKSRIKTPKSFPDFQQWGTFVRGTDEIHLHKKENTGNEDLSEFSANQTLLNGGTVYVVEPEKMPDTESLAAVFRH